MQTLKILQERAIQKFEKDHRLEDGRLADIGFNGGTTEDFMNSLITEVWNEAIKECEGRLNERVEELVAEWDEQEQDEGLANQGTIDRCSEAKLCRDILKLLPKPNITCDKTDGL